MAKNRVFKLAKTDKIWPFFGLIGQKLDLKSWPQNRLNATLCNTKNLFDLKKNEFSRQKWYFLQRAEQLTPYPQPRFYDPLSSRTFDRSQDKSKSRSNSKRFHFGPSPQHNHNHHSAGHRENRLLAGHGAGQHGNGLHGDGHGHHHQHHNEIIERIDEVIELVDCGGRDLGFCDMSSKYPGSDIIFQFSVKPIFRHSSEWMSKI